MFSGGGREKAGGVNNLNASEIDNFKKEFERTF
jgi:hypothetical protein